MTLLRRPDALPRRRGRAALAGAGLLGAVVLAGCTGDETSDRTPEEALAEAKVELDATPGVRLSLEVSDLPDGVDGLLAAEGVATSAPAFEGQITVSVSGITADADVIAVNDKVYAVLPFTTKYAEIDPADYGAPDPADLVATEGGLSSLLVEATEVSEGEQVRSGEDVLSTYTGVLAGDAVAEVIPSADPEGSFDASFTLTDDDRLQQVVLTGPFYPEAADVTYTIDVEDYGTEQDITAP